MFEAFGQHFAFRWREEFLPNGTPWNRWHIAIARAFGPEVDSVLDLFRTQPQRVFAHMAANARDAVPRLAKLLFSHTPYVFKKRPLWEGMLWAGVFAALALWQGWHKLRHPRFRKDYVSLLLVEVILALPIVGSVLFIYPRMHYLLGVTLLLWFAWAVLVLGHTEKAKANVHRRAFGVGLALAVFLTATTPPSTAHFGYRPILDVRETLLTLRALRAAGMDVVGVPPELWENAIAIYVPGVEHAPVSLEDLSPKASLQIDAVVALAGRQLRQESFRQRIMAWEEAGWQALCSTRGFYLVLTRIAAPPDVPMQPCFR